MDVNVVERRRSGDVERTGDAMAVRTVSQRWPLLDVKSDLRKRIPAELARRIQLTNDLAKRHVLMGHRLVADALDLPHRLSERHRAGDAEPHDERVDEEADQPLQSTIEALGDWNRNGDVLGPRVTVQQAPERGQHQHEQADPLGTSETLEPIAQPLGDVEPHGVCALRRIARTRVVGRPLLDGQVRQLFSPVGAQPIGPVAGEALPLPQGEVPILQGERRSVAR